MKIVDMHVHSNFSDGLYSIEVIIDKVLKMGLAGFALTDHDTFDGIEKTAAILKKNNAGLFFIAGCEFSTYLEEVGEIHILAYFHDYNFINMNNLISQFKESRIKRALKIIDCLSKFGYGIKPDILIKENKIVGRMHIARELVSLGYFNDTDKVFEKLLRPGAPCYIPRKEINTYEIIKEIKNNDGKAVLAHPTLLYNKNNWEFLTQMIACGLDGIEYKHPRLSQELSNKIEEKYLSSLILTSGSDFHGDDGKEGLGKFGMEMSEVVKNFSKFTDI